MTTKTTRTLLGAALIVALAPLVRAQSIIVYSGPDYRGEQQSLGRPTPRLGDLGWSDRIASIQVSGGEWQLCRQENFAECITVSGSVPNLTRWGMDYAVRSARPAVRPQQLPATADYSITVFEGPGFRGERQRFDREIGRLLNQGWSDRIGSVAIGAGEWELCTEDGFRDCVTVSTDQAELASQRLDYRIRSLRPVVPAPVEPPPTATPPTSLPSRMTPAQAEFVAERLYRAVLGRSPDAEGLRNASSEILFGNLEKLTNSLVFSSEARDARLSPEQKLERIYQGLLNRPPGAGAQGYLDRVRQGRTTDVVLTVLDSEEFLRQLPQ